MAVLHHRIHILEVPDAAMRVHLKQSRAMRRAVIMELDEAHWLINGRCIGEVERLCAKAGITLSVKTHGD